MLLYTAKSSLIIPSHRFFICLPLPYSILCTVVCLPACLPVYLPACLYRPDEKERIIAARGWITEEKELYMARLHRMDLTHPIVRDKAQQVCIPLCYCPCSCLCFCRWPLSLSHYKTCICTVTSPLMPSHPIPYHSVPCTAL